MRVHGNAKTNVYQRQLLIRRVCHQGWTQRQAAEALGVSVRTVAKWLARDRTALADRSSRPERQPRRTRITTEAAIVALRRTRATAWQISAALGVPRSTVTRVLARAGLNRVALVEPSGPIQRYEWPSVGDLLHLDLKRLGRVVGIGHRIHGDRRRRSRKAGYEFLHVAIDDATRLTYAEVLSADDAPACAAFLRRTLRWFRRRGVQIRRLLTDNAMAYRSRAFCGVCRTWAVRQPTPGPIDRRPTARPNDLSKRSCANGRTGCRTAPPRGERPLLARISGSITTDVHTRASAVAHRGCVSKRRLMNNLFDIHN